MGYGKLEQLGYTHTAWRKAHTFYKCGVNDYGGTGTYITVQGGYVHKTEHGPKGGPHRVPLTVAEVIACADFIGGAEGRNTNEKH